MSKYMVTLGMPILPYPAWPTLSRFAPRKLSLPHKGDGAGMGWDFSAAQWGEVVMSLVFLDPTYSTPPCTDKC